MAVLTRAAWDTIVNQLIDSGGTPRISAADARSVLDDLGDSVVFKDELIDVIDDMLGGNTWQTGGGGGGTGVSLAQVFNAIRTAGTVNGIELAKGVSGSVLTLTLQMVAVGAHGRYAAIIDNTNRDPTEFTAAIFTAPGAVMANSDTIAAPAYAGSSTFVSLGFATPSPLTGVQEEGNVLAPNIRSSFLPAVGDTDVIITIPGEGAHYVYAGYMNRTRAGLNYVLTEA